MALFKDVGYKNRFGYKGVLSMIWARLGDGGIGKDGDLPWKRLLPTDLKFFKALTSHNPNAVLVVGSSTFRFLPPLPGRDIIVLSRTPKLATKGKAGSVEYRTSIEVLLKEEKRDIIVIGGGTIYEQFMPFADVLYETIIASDTMPADTFINPVERKKFEFMDTHIERNCDKSGIDVIFVRWESKELPGTTRYFDVRERYNYTLTHMVQGEA